MKGFKDKEDKFIPTEPSKKFGSNQINSSTDVDPNDTGFTQRASGKKLIESGTREIPADSMKICSRCDNHFNIDASRNGRTMSHLPLCNNCDDKGLKPLGYPAHWVWNKMTSKERQLAFEGVILDGTHFNEDNEENWIRYNYGDTDFDNLPKSVQDILKTKWGIET